MRFGIILLEIKDVRQVGTTPRIDGLVVVAHDHDVAMLSREQLSERVLSVVGVLILVHQQVAEPILIDLEHLFMVLKQEIRIEEQVVEIERIEGAQTFLQHFVDAPDNLRRRVFVAVFEHLGRYEFVLRLRDTIAHHALGIALWVDVEFGHDALHEALRVGIVVDGESWRKA